MATIESLNNHVEHQNRQTESLCLELRQSLKSQSDLQTQLSALRDARHQNDIHNSLSTVCGPEGSAVLGPRVVPMVPIGGDGETNDHEYTPSIARPAALRQTVKHAGTKKMLQS